MAATYLFYDYETDGADPVHSRPYQFACIRTDEQLNPVPGPEGEGVVLWCRPPEDRLPAPEAVLITGITPQHAAVEGRTEADFFGAIHQQFNVPGTISLGWNSLRFDDTVSRFGFWRTFLDPYSHGWAAGCRCWDLIDLARACYAFRPDGIVWPAYADDEWSENRLPVAPEDGSPSFKLDMIAPANGIEHSGAHDALADVRASIEFARLIKSLQPKLWEKANATLTRETAEKLLKSGRPLLHASARIPNEHGCGSIMHVVARSHQNPKEYIAWDLRHDPTPLLDADVDTIRKRAFSSNDQLQAEGLSRFRLKGIKSNRGPFLLEATKPLMASIDTHRIQLDLDACRTNFQVLASAPEDLRDRVAKAWSGRVFDAATDADDMLYDGFVETADRKACDAVAQASPSALTSMSRSFKDHRLPPLLLHYRARNAPDSLDDKERAIWKERCAERLLHPPGKRPHWEDPDAPDPRAWPHWLTHIQALHQSEIRTEQERQHLEATMDWGRSVVASAGLDVSTPTGSS